MIHPRLPPLVNRPLPGTEEMILCRKEDEGDEERRIREELGLEFAGSRDGQENDQQEESVRAVETKEVVLERKASPIPVREVTVPVVDVKEAVLERKVSPMPARVQETFIPGSLVSTEAAAADQDVVMVEGEEDEAMPAIELDSDSDSE